MPMLNAEQVLGIYENVSSLTRQMLLAAQASDWDQLSELESRCAHEVGLLRQPRHPCTQRLLAAVEIAPAVAQALRTALHTVPLPIILFTFNTFPFQGQHLKANHEITPIINTHSPRAASHSPVLPCRHAGARNRPDPRRRPDAANRPSRRLAGMVRLRHQKHDLRRGRPARHLLARQTHQRQRRCRHGYHPDLPVGRQTGVTKLRHPHHLRRQNPARHQ